MGHRMSAVLVLSMLLGCGHVCAAPDDTTEPWTEWEPEPNGDVQAEPEFTPSEKNATGPSVAILARQFMYFKVGMALQRYYIPILVPIGLIGNVLSLLVMFRKQNRRVSCCVYMIALAFSDIVMLITAVYLWAIPEISPRDWGPLRVQVRLLRFRDVRFGGSVPDHVHDL